MVFNDWPHFDGQFLRNRVQRYHAVGVTVEVTSEKFVQRKLSESDKRKLQGFSKPLVRLKLRFQARVLNRLYDDFDDTLISNNADGSFDVEIVFPEDEWVYGYIMSFGSFVEVIEPEHIREILADRMRRALQYYEK